MHHDGGTDTIIIYIWFEYCDIFEIPTLGATCVYIQWSKAVHQNFTIQKIIL